VTTTPTPEPRKRCPKCRRSLALSRFGPNESATNREASWCRRCFSQVHRKRGVSPPAPLVDFSARRVCLRCGRRFGSTGPGNRLCGRCYRATEQTPEPQTVRDPRV
jgi:hypothetical protein